MPEAEFQPSVEEAAARERELIERTIAGDEDAFRELVQTYYRVVFRAAYRALRSPAQAEDTTQDVFFKVFQNLRGYRFEQPFIHWLHRITSNTIVDAVRRVRPVISLDAQTQLPGGGGQDPQRAFAERELARKLAAAIGALPSASRSVLILRVYQELSYREIAQALDIPLGTVMSRLHNAKEMLRKSLGDVLDVGEDGQPAEVNKS